MEGRQVLGQEDLLVVLFACPTALVVTKVGGRVPPGPTSRPQSVCSLDGDKFAWPSASHGGGHAAPAPVISVPTGRQKEMATAPLRIDRTLAAQTWSPSWPKLPGASRSVLLQDNSNRNPARVSVRTYLALRGPPCCSSSRTPAASWGPSSRLFWKKGMST